MSGDVFPSFQQVVVCSGHMIDASNRKEPRFPAAKAEAVRASIGSQLDEWKVNGRTLALCGGASGADTLFGEEALLRGASLRILLAQEKEAFIDESVAGAGEEWVQRFHRLIAKAQVYVLPPAQSPEEEKL